VEDVIRQSGYPLYRADGKALGFSDPSPIKEFFEMELRLLNAGALFDPSEGSLVVAMEEEPFSKGKTWNASFRWSNQFVGTSAAAGGIHVEGALIPRISNFRKNAGWFHPSMYISISSGTKNPKLAAQFVDFFLNDIEANTILQAERGVPIPDNVRSHLASIADPVTKQVFDFIDLLAKNSSPADPPDPPGSGECETVLNDIQSQILTKKISIDEGIARYMEKCNQILSGSF
jgi:multiple sugar transport system substrate-binding protein